MGRIKTQFVKRTTKKLLADYPEKFSDSYEHNKEALRQLLEVESPKIRNVIAGYLTRLKRVSP